MPVHAPPLDCVNVHTLPSECKLGRLFQISELCVQFLETNQFIRQSCRPNVRFSNRPVRVKRFQTIHRCSVDVARGLVLLFGIGTKALPVWDSRTRWNNLLGGLAVKRTAGPSGQTNSPHPPSCEGHLSTARWSSGFLLSHLVLYRSHAAASSRVQRNSVPSTHMRCMMTASRRAKATIAFFIPRCLAIFTAQALSHDHLLARVNMT